MGVVVVMGSGGRGRGARAIFGDSGGVGGDGAPNIILSLIWNLLRHRQQKLCYRALSGMQYL